MIRIAGILRKSPTNKNVVENIDEYKQMIVSSCDSDFGEGAYEIVWFIDDSISGDDPNRPELFKFAKRMDDYDYAYCPTVDRFARSWLGQKWFFEFFTTNNGREPHKGCKLRIGDIGDLYTDKGFINHENYLLFAMKCSFAQYDLFKIRSNSARGRNRVLSDPKLRAIKYKGRKKGSKNKPK